VNHPNMGFPESVFVKAKNLFFGGYIYMNKKLLLAIITTILMGGFASAIVPESNYAESAIEKIKITDSDVPAGFTYGQIPPFAKTVLLNNPWEMNRAAINKLTKNIYPNGDASAVRKMHLSILAKNNHPYGYDIVCYIIIFTDGSAARKEIEKLSAYSKHNSDRTILVTNGNLAVFLIANDINNYKYIDEMKTKMEQRISSL
jgi:hypothetical protein